MNTLKLSIIVPLFNGEKYLSRCIDSLLNQDIKYSEYEILCVDDCSTDNTVSIVESYISTNSNIRLIKHKFNMKTGSTCNTGLLNAAGKYLWFVGQDDWIEPDSIKKIIEKCESDNLDILVFNYKRVSESEELLSSQKVFHDTSVMKGRDFINNNFSDTFQHYLLGYEWRGVYNKKYLDKNKILFKNEAIYEDTVFLFKAIFYAERFSGISDFIYNYRVNILSITDYSKKYRGYLVFEFAFVAGNEVLDLAKELKQLDSKVSHILYSTAIWYFKSFTYKVIASSIREKKEFYKLVSRNIKQVKSALEITSFYERILANPYSGLFLTILLKPLYLLRKKIKQKNKVLQDWCY